MKVLSARQAGSVAHLAVYRYLTRSQLAAFLFEGEGSTAPHSQEVLAQRILRQLTAGGLVVPLPRPRSELGGGVARVAYGLTRAGHAAAAKLSAGATDRRPAVRSTVQLSHGLVTADVALAFRRAAHSIAGHAVTEWELDRHAASRAGSTPVIPDAFLVYATPACELNAFIEVDLDTERPRIFGQKIRKYLELYRSGTWRSHVRAWPIVATITPTETRAKVLQRVAESVLLSEPDADRIGKLTEFDFGALPDVLGTAGPLGGIWRVAGRSGLHRLIPDTPIGGGPTSARPATWPTPPSGVERCVYVIELADVEGPRTTALPCVYVGQSAYPSETRFAQHKMGYKASRVVRRYGRQLRPDLCSKVACTPDWQTALRREADLAVELRRAGYCVHGGH
jgi:hypothetical protein